VAFIISLFLDNQSFGVSEVIKIDWLWVPILLGAVFFIMFNLIGLSASKVGMAITGLLNKLSLIIPLILGYFIYGDRFNEIGYIGMGLGLISLFFVTNKIVLKNKIRPTLVLLIVIQFLGPGLIDSFLKYVEEYIIASSDYNLFSGLTFLFSFFCGFLYLIFQRKFRFTLKDLAIGSLLGFVNFGTIYFMLRALHSIQESSKVFLIINLGIIICTSVVGIVIFKEKINKIQILGIILALVSCYLIA
jgi:drug/metabolite transporter (DMT)-like permease